MIAIGGLGERDVVVETLCRITMRSQLVIAVLLSHALLVYSLAEGHKSSDEDSFLDVLLHYCKVICTGCGIGALLGALIGLGGWSGMIIGLVCGLLCNHYFFG